MRIKSNKRGQGATYDTMVNSIATFLVIFVLIGGIVLLSSRTSDAATTETCRTSVLVRDKANIEIKGIKVAEKLTPILCKTTDVKTLKGTRDEIKKQIADFSAICWHMYAEGNVADLFKNEVGEKGCNICYFFQIDEVKEDTPAKIPMDETKSIGRPANKISVPELYNFMMTNRYNPPIIRGGGTKNTTSDEYELSKDHLEFKQKKGIGEVISEIKISDIQGKGVKSFVKDYSGFFDKDIANQIDTEIGSRLLREKDVDLLVLVAEKFDTTDRADVRELYDSLNINSDKDKYDGILVLVDISEGTIRLLLGRNLDVYIYEPDIEDLIRDSVRKHTVDSEVDVSLAVQEIVNNIGGKILNDKKSELFSKHGIDSKSYYAYLSNGINYPLFVDDIQSGLSYTISYMSGSDSATFMKKLEIASALSGIIPTSVAPGASIGNLLGVFFLEEMGVIDTDVRRPNYILIARTNTGQKYCKTME